MACDMRRSSCCLPKLKNISIDYFEFVSAHTVFLQLRMQRMQALINEGRKVRDKTKINLRTPMSKVVVVHSDAQFRSDISSLSFLVKDELNLVDVEVTLLLASTRFFTY